MSNHRLCTFRVASLHVGVRVERVQEVLRDEILTPVPLTDRCVAGLLNLRGQIVTAIDARHRLGLPAGGEHDPTTNVVIRTGKETVSLVVDSEDEVIDVDDDAFEEVPETIASTIRAVMTGAYKVNGGLLLCLDADRALAPGAN